MGEKEREVSMRRIQKQNKGGGREITQVVKLNGRHFAGQDTGRQAGHEEWGMREGGKTGEGASVQGEKPRG